MKPSAQQPNTNTHSGPFGPGADISVCTTKNHKKDLRFRLWFPIFLGHRRYQPLKGELSASALEPAPDDTSVAEDLACRIVSWEAKYLPKNSSLVHFWAEADNGC